MRELRREVDLLIRRVGRWSAPRWAGQAGDAGLSRADLVHRLVQRLADDCADAEGEPCRPVPRLENELALVDQLRVISADLVAAQPPSATLTSAAAETAAVREAL